MPLSPLVLPYTFKYWYLINLIKHSVNTPVNISSNPLFPIATTVSILRFEKKRRSYFLGQWGHLKIKLKCIYRSDAYLANHCSRYISMYLVLTTLLGKIV